MSSLEGGKTQIAVMDIETDNFTNSFPIGDPLELEWFRWAGNHRILAGVSDTTTIYGIEVRYTRTFVFDIATDKVGYVGRQDMGIIGDDVLYVDPDGEWMLLAMQASVFVEPEVWRFSLDRQKTGLDEKIQKRKPGIWGWYADDDGVVRMGIDGSGPRTRVIYRRSAEEDFKTIARLRDDGAEEEYWDALRIVGGRDEGYLIRADERGRQVLRRFNYATREEGEVIFSNPDWDVTDYDLDDSGNPVAAYFTDDRDRIAWLDEKMARTQANLDKALPGQEVWIISRSRDDSRMLVWAGAPNDPGSWYIFTPAAKSLDQFTILKPGIEPSDLADVRPVRYKARDGVEIAAYLTLPRGRPAKALPLIVMPHGGPYGVRDKLDYSDEVQLLANRGYAVLQPNYRGSGGYGENFETLGAGQIGRAMQDDLDDAVAWAVQQGLADKSRVCMVGASYGGYAAMWSIIRNPEIYRCAVSFAGVSDYKAQLSYDNDSLTRSARKGWKEKIRGENGKFDLDQISPALQASRIGSPLLLAHGKKDRRVLFKQHSKMQSALQKVPGAKVEFLELEDSGHGFYTPEDEQAYYDALTAFLTRYNPADEVVARKPTISPSDAPPAP